MLRKSLRIVWGCFSGSAMLNRPDASRFTKDVNILSPCISYGVAPPSPRTSTRIVQVSFQRWITSTWLTWVSLLQLVPSKPIQIQYRRPLDDIDDQQCGHRWRWLVQRLREQDINLPWNIGGWICQPQLIYVRPRSCLNKFLRCDICDLDTIRTSRGIDRSDWFIGDSVIVVMPDSMLTGVPKNKMIFVVQRRRVTERRSAHCFVAKLSWDPVSNSARRVCFWWSTDE